MYVAEARGGGRLKSQGRTLPPVDDRAPLVALAVPLARAAEPARTPPTRHELDLPMRERNTEQLRRNNITHWLGHPCIQLLISTLFHGQPNNIYNNTNEIYSLKISEKYTKQKIIII